MIENKNCTETTTAELVEVQAESTPLTPTQQILAPLTLEDYSQFLYETSYGGKKGQDFTYEGVKTLGLNNGVSTSDVKVEFLNDERTDALFYCRATDRNGDTSDVVVRQKETENGRANPNWIEKGCSRAIRNAIKARLPVQLFKSALQRAIAAGEAKQSAIVEAQKALGITFAERDDSLCHINKPTFYAAAHREYGDAEHWDAETWLQVTDDLKNMAEWVKSIPKGPF